MLSISDVIEVDMQLRSALLTANLEVSARWLADTWPCSVGDLRSRRARGRRPPIAGRTLLITA